MAKKKDITSKKAKLCIGSMSFRILLQKRLKVNKANRTEFSFETVHTVWAGKQTKDGLEKFSGININKIPDTIWKIRTISTLTSELWVNENDILYDIIKVERINGGDFQLIYCRETGSSSLNGNKS